MTYNFSCTSILCCTRFCGVALMGPILAIAPSQATAQSASPAATHTLQDRLRDAEDAAREARDAAKRAQEAAIKADQAWKDLREAAASAGLKLPDIVIAIVDDPAVAKPCSLDDADDRELLARDPRECESMAIHRSGVASKPRDRRGINTVIKGSSQSSNAELKLSFDHFFRLPPASNSDESFQRAAKSTFTVGVRAPFNKDDKTRATIGKLDELSSAVTLLASYGRAYYPPENLRYRDKLGLNLRLERLYQGADGKGLKTDCETAKADRAKLLAHKPPEPPKLPPTVDCAGPGLLDWIFSVDDAGKFRNPKAVEAYNLVLWSSPAAQPRHGWGVSGEIAKPKFNYYPFKLTDVVDAFDPAKTKTVIDPAFFPSDLSTLNVDDERHLTWSLKGFYFYHLDGGAGYSQWFKGTTFKGSIAWQREYDYDDGRKDVQVCPAPAAGIPFTTDQLCRKLNIAAPRRETGLILGGEVRQLFDPPAPFPMFAVAPRYTFNVANDRNGLDIPIYFATDDSGKFSSGFSYGWEWGGYNLDGSRKDKKSGFSIFIETKFDLNGAN